VAAVPCAPFADSLLPPGPDSACSFAVLGNHGWANCPSAICPAMSTFFTTGSSPRKPDGFVALGPGGRKYKNSMAASTEEHRRKAPSTSLCSKPICIRNSFTSAASSVAAAGGSCTSQCLFMSLLGLRVSSSALGRVTALPTGPSLALVSSAASCPLACRGRDCCFGRGSSMSSGSSLCGRDCDAHDTSAVDSARDTVGATPPWGLSPTSPSAAFAITEASASAVCSARSRSELVAGKPDVPGTRSAAAAAARISAAFGHSWRWPKCQLMIQQSSPQNLTPQRQHRNAGGALPGAWGQISQEQRSSAVLMCLARPATLGRHRC